jgi:hypothetical protein
VSFFYEFAVTYVAAAVFHDVFCPCFSEVMLLASFMSFWR